MSLVMTAFSQTILFKSLLAITLLLIDLYEGDIGNFKAVKYNYVYFKYDFEHLLWFKNDFLNFNMFKIPH